MTYIRLKHVVLHNSALVLGLGKESQATLDL